MKYLVNPVLIDSSNRLVTEKSNIAMNESVNVVMQGTITYDDLIDIVTDNNGKIVMLQANTIQINALTRNIIDYTYKSLFNNKAYEVKIPLGSFTGIPIFNSLGPKIGVDIMPYGNVYCTFLSKFISAGINQTYHKIYVSIKTDARVVLPLNTIDVETYSEVLFCESLIIGEVPSTYLMAENTGDLLNMVN